LSSNFWPGASGLIVPPRVSPVTVNAGSGLSLMIAAVNGCLAMSRTVISASWPGLRLTGTTRSQTARALSALSVRVPTGGGGGAGAKPAGA
jgi:hypothetical protein